MGILVPIELADGSGTTGQVISKEFVCPLG